MSLLQKLFDFGVQTFAGIAPMAVALGEHRASLLGRCSFYAPFFNSGDVHGRVEQF
jgi:hypothetical protein